MDVPVAAAPAQPAITPDPTPTVTPAVPTAADHAVESKDFAAYRDAKRAESRGTPLTPPAASPEPVAPVPGVSKRQQEINDLIRARTAAEVELARLRDENVRLKAAPASAQAVPPGSPASPTAPAPPAPAGDPEPTADAYDSYDAFVKAQARWQTRQELATRDAEAQTRASRDAHASAERARQTSFTERVNAAAAADPTFLEALHPDVLSLKPFAALAPGEPGGPLNVVAEELLESPVAPQLLRHLSAHPEELQRIAALTDSRAVIRAISRLEATVDRGPASTTPIPKTVPGAPPPPPTVATRSAELGDPVDSAVNSRNFEAFRAAKRARVTRR